MKMKKPASMATVLSRTCPRCFTMVDPVWYGWHITNCTSSDKQDRAPSTALMSDEAHISELVGAAREEVSLSLPASCTLSLAPDSQFLEENSREENTASEHESTQLRVEKQALADRVIDLELQLEGLKSRVNAEKQAMADKVKDLELTVENLECKLKLSKELERGALWLVDSLRDSLKEKTGHINEVGKCNQLLETITLEPKSMGSDKKTMAFGNNECDKQGKEVDDQDKHLDHSKERAVETIMTINADDREEIQLDCVLGPACTGGPISDYLLSQVDGFIESHKSSGLKENISTTQEIRLEPSVNAIIGDLYQVIVAKNGNQDSTKQHSYNGSASTLVVDEEHHTAPRDALGTSFDISNEGFLNNCPADGNGGAKPNEESVVKLNDCGVHLDAQGAALEMLFQALDKDTSTEVPQVLCGEEFHAKRALLLSSSSSSEVEGPVFKAKTGLRRIVLSDSESEGDNRQDVCEGGNRRDIHTGIHTNACNSKEPDLPYTSTRSIEELGRDSSAEFRARDTDTAHGVEIRVSQQPFSRRKQLKLLQSSDISDDAVCTGVSEQSSPKSVEGPIASASNPEGAAVDGIEDGEQTGVRRSKRLRNLKAQDKDLCILSSRRKIRRAIVARETSSSIEGLKESKSEASGDTYSKEAEASLEVQGIPSRKKRFHRRVVTVPSSNSDEETSGHDERSPRERSKRPPRVRKRLFEEVESKPAYGNNHSSDNEEDDIELESDEDSLKDFIVEESEGTEEESRSSDNNQSSTGSHSSREAFCDPRLKRDIKIRHYVWELEPEMLATFAIDPELCLRAVCAINRRQTEDEQNDKVCKYVNNRGFDKLHAGRGTRIAEFLTDGEPEGPVKKTIEDLKKFDAGGLRFCKMIAAKHSKQLFEIYTIGEDPHFPFS